MGIKSNQPHYQKNILGRIWSDLVGFGRIDLNFDEPSRVRLALGAG